MTMAVGAPIPVGPPTPDPSKELIARTADIYFAALCALFEKHKVEAGYPRAELVFAE